MTTIATRNLTGAALDWAVATCEVAAGHFSTNDKDFSAPFLRMDPAGFASEYGPNVFSPVEIGLTEYGRQQAVARGKEPETHRWSPSVGFFRPSVVWSWAGPIIEREGIGMRCLGSAGDDQWAAWIDQDMACFAPTPLVAAMRCYVAHCLGETVDVPEDLA